MKYNQIDTGVYTIYFAEEGYKYLADYIKEKKYSKIFVLLKTVDLIYAKLIEIK